MTHNETSQKTPLPSAVEKTKLAVFIKTFLMPTLVGKTLVLYFGINYSLKPGEGYGYGLVFAILFTLFGLLRFFWKYRNHEEF